MKNTEKKTVILGIAPKESAVMRPLSSPPGSASEGVAGLRALAVTGLIEPGAGFNEPGWGLATRNPTLLFSFVGVLLFRFDAPSEGTAGFPCPPLEKFRTPDFLDAMTSGMMPYMARELSPFDAPTDRTLSIIMGGGAGTRLFPLTKDRSKPAVPLGGKYRLVDIPISNCLNSALPRMYVLTQFNSVSLHRHIHATYKFDSFSKGFVGILAAQQTSEGSHWYQGTADAVRQNLRYFLQQSDDEYFLILSGDQLYQMDYRVLLKQHIESGADITLATIPVQREAAPAFGIMHTDAQRRVIRFDEKPKEPALLDELKIPAPLLQELGRDPGEELYQASMGIYVFNRRVLVECLDNDLVDFGKHVIPAAIKERNVMVYLFQGYWEDIGTIRAFYEANLALTDPRPPYSFFDARGPIYTRPRYLPATKIESAVIEHAIISDGCRISNATLNRCVIGLRSVVRNGTTIRNSVVMGSDYWDTTIRRQEATEKGWPLLGIGKNCHIEQAIIDKNARIGDDVKITPQDGVEDRDEENYHIRDGIVVVPKNAVIPSGTSI